MKRGKKPESLKEEYAIDPGKKHEFLCDDRDLPKFVEYLHAEVRKILSSYDLDQGLESGLEDSREDEKE